MTPTLVPCRTCLITGAVLLALGCGSGPTDPTPVVPPPPPPPPPLALKSIDGAWTFALTVTTGNGGCTGMIGQQSSDRINFSQNGVAAPYEIIAESVDRTRFRGNLTREGSLFMGGVVVSEKIRRTPSYWLQREGSDRLVGTGAATYLSGGQCYVMWDVVATRD